MGERWHGLRFPFKKAAQGWFTEPRDADLIESSIKFILATAEDEYITLPGFGSKLPEDLMEPNDLILEALVKRHVTDALSRWEPRIIVLNVDSQADEDEVRLFLTYATKDNPDEIRFFHDAFERGAR